MGSFLSTCRFPVLNTFIPVKCEHHHRVSYFPLGDFKDSGAPSAGLSEPLITEVRILAGALFPAFDCSPVVIRDLT